MSTFTAQHVANSILDFCNVHGDLVSNLKLQKLLYYTQAWYLALRKRQLFPEDFQAWVHGPVVPSVYRQFKPYGFGPILRGPRSVASGPVFNRHLADVMATYSRFSAFDLERMTHSERPWQNARGGIPPDEPSRAVISKADMTQFYGARLHGKAK